ncbi:MAG TPA: phosphoglycerate kinase [Firmicutes bacterium]|nr:phosphoglycerate kinase [Bacillota bacterium]
MSKLSIKDIPMEGKRVFVRVDFNVPLSDEGKVIDDTRIRSALPTIKYLMERGCRIILASHLGRPKGRVVEKLRMDPVAEQLSRLLGCEVRKSDTVVGEEVEEAVAALPPGGILLLENVRFESGEEKNDDKFAAALARLGDIFVNDAFGTAHRAHASNNGIARYLPAVAGFLMEKEINYLNKSKENPPSPQVAILGGKKVADKIGVIYNFMRQVDSLLLGGAMANTFLKAKGYFLGDSFCENDKLKEVEKILEGAENSKAEIILPVDVVIAKELRAESPHKVVGVKEIPAGWSAVDIGPETVNLFKKKIAGAKMILWNGPLGAYEYVPFNRGTKLVAEAVAGANAESIVGGGDIVAALEDLGLTDKITHISTGGGAVLDFWEGKELPGLAVLQEYSRVGS